MVFFNVVFFLLFHFYYFDVRVILNEGMHAYSACDPHSQQYLLNAAIYYNTNLFFSLCYSCVLFVNVESDNK